MDSAEYPEDRNAGRRIGSAARILAMLGGAILLGTAGLTTASVALRALAGGGITGDFELVQLAAAVAAFCFFPLCLAVRGNVVVDTFTARLPKRLTDGLDAAWTLLFGVIAGVLAWRLAVGAAEHLQTRTTLMMLPLPTWWAIALCAAFTGFLALISIVVGCRALSGKA